ncbi:hypothetical protein [Streptomyces sp. bgisy159]|uniref:hypothetical protein n=1 Tax=Streptomyces sp. bgisy159 TaxID=3413795 RepID=UPI003F49E889
MPTHVRIGRRYNGPPDSANGGYACGVFAEAARPVLGTGGRGGTGDVVVQLLAPPPLETDLRVVAGRRVTFWDGDDLIASAAVGAVPQEPVGFVDPPTARRAEQGYAGRAGHPFDTCYVCGPRHDDHGLRLAPGPVAGRAGTTACTWTPGDEHTGDDGLVRPELVWAVLDCPGGWTFDPVATPMVLGRMTARVRALPRAGETTVLTARGVPSADRAVRCETAIFRHDGTELGRSSAVWVRRDEKALS